MLHANARTCPKSRQLLVDRINAGWSVMEAAEAAGITDRTARRSAGMPHSTDCYEGLRRMCSALRIVNNNGCTGAQNLDACEKSAHLGHQAQRDCGRLSACYVEHARPNRKDPGFEGTSLMTTHNGNGS